MISDEADVNSLIFVFLVFWYFLGVSSLNGFNCSECELAEFASGVSTERIPFVYLPLSGQLVCLNKIMIEFH